MPCFLAPIFVLMAVGAGEPLVPTASFSCDGDAWPVALTPDGKSLMCAVLGDDRCDVIVWDTVSKSPTSLVKRQLGVPLSVSPDRQYVAGMIQSGTKDTSEDMQIVIWDVAKRSTTDLIKLNRKSVFSLWPVFTCQSAMFSSDSRQFALADCKTGKVYVWKRGEAGTWGDPKTLELAQRPDVRKPTAFDLHFRRDGKELLAFFPIGKDDESDPSFAAEAWDVASGHQAECTIPAVKSYVFYTGPFPRILSDNTLCYQGSEGRGVVGIDISSGKKKYDLPAFTIFAQLSPDQKTCADLHWMLMGIDERTVTAGFWNFDDGTQRRTVELPKCDKPPIAVFSPDSRYFLCTAGAGGRSVFLIDVKTCKVLSSWTATAVVRGLYPLGTGEVAVITAEPKSIQLSKVSLPE
jgi:WD40 repeat protein